MKLAKIFISGNSQAIRLPKEFRFSSREVWLKKIGERLVVSEKKPSWNSLKESVGMFTEDFMSNGREQNPNYDKRENF